MKTYRAPAKCCTENPSIAYTLIKLDTIRRIVPYAKRYRWVMNLAAQRQRQRQRGGYYPGESDAMRDTRQ